jgi:hypothetical protein
MVPRSEADKKIEGVKNVPMVLGGKIFNYLGVDFNISEKMGPKMIPVDSKSSKNQE